MGADALPDGGRQERAQADAAGLLHALSHGATEEQAAAQAFGDSEKIAKRRCSRYIGNAAFYYIKEPPPPEIAAGDLHVRELSEAEVDAYRGGFAAVTGRTQEAITDSGTAP